FAHFFAAMGTDVTILQRGSRLVPGEEAEVSELLKTSMNRRMKIYTGTEAVEVREKEGVLTVVGRDKNSGQSVEFSAEKILVAAGRTSNADLLKVENTGVKTDQRGYIVVNKFLETTKKEIWAIGDAIGKAMFRHAANEEAEVAWHNSGTGSGHKAEMDYSATPHAVFTSPQIASVGLREAEARESQGEILVGKAMYSEVAKGAAMMEGAAFAKAIVDKETLQILGFHIIGPYAAILLQEVVNAMANKLDIYSIGRAMHIHPALSELVVATLGNLAETS
ncbi:MAG TPA: dihydrolipoyl dehydrogenase, partial [Euryarchaeota archaeon]|nr:dihydrolipoyl dehydrogenase [Euryarchaeota archaeon]